MRLLAAVALTLVAASTPGAARAETCEEVHESCLESCRIDFGMEKERIKLTKCVRVCDSREDECGERRQEQHRSNVRFEEHPTDTRYTPSDVRPVVEDEAPTNVRPAELDDDEPGDRRGRSRRPPPEPDPAPASEEPAATEGAEEASGRTEPPAAEDPPARRPKPAAEEDRPPPKREKRSDPGSDDWAK